MNLKNSDTKDEDLEYLRSIWPELTYWQRKHLLLLAWWFHITNKVEGIPARWVEYQLKRQNRLGKGK
jgi:hypothetical protein